MTLIRAAEKQSPGEPGFGRSRGALSLRSGTSDAYGTKREQQRDDPYLDEEDRCLCVIHG